MSDGDGGGIRGNGRDQTTCHYSVRIDLPSDGDHREHENNSYGSHGPGCCASIRQNQSHISAKSGLSADKCPALTQRSSLHWGKQKLKRNQ
jgi:hypothetical protein